MTAMLTVETGTTTKSGKRYKARIVVEGRGIIGQAIDADERLACKRAIRQARKWADDRKVALSIHRAFSRR